ncbi:MAG: hypothetical protein AAB281_01175, partial [Actinomycetota bacterium]
MASKKKKSTVRPRHSGKAKGSGPGKAKLFSKAHIELQGRGFLQENLLIIFLLLIPLLGLLSYSNTFHVSFIFDDLIQITSNSAIRSFGGLLDHWDLSRIVGYFTFALNYRTHELNVTGYHIFNLAVHLINALLVFWLVSLTLNAPFFQKVRNDGAVSRLTVSTIALFSSLLFVAH